MKKILVLIAVFIGTVFYAQRTTKEVEEQEEQEEQEERKITSTGYTKSDKIFTGGISYIGETTGAVNKSGFAINPKLGFFLSDKFVLGFGFNYSSSSDESPLSGKEEQSTIGGGLFARLYIHPKNDFSFFFNLDATYESLAEKKSNGGITTETSGGKLNFGLSPAVSFFFSQNVAIEASFGNFGYTSITRDVGDPTTKLGVGFDLSTLKLGLTIKL